MPKFLVKKYYSTFFEQEVEADNEDDAYEKSKDIRDVPSAMDELKDNLSLWSDADELSSNQESLTTFVNGLLHRCRKHLYLGISNYSENGFEQQGNLLKAFQGVFQSYL